ncbi:hypothetical protein K7432_007172 [Basidiobolus ranarum]|uniref:Myb-like domain-containing protein n=1 Tax=Basidiobolus ranarum TaxID=34480 RepID=A0ABR2W0P8_9FUNG
MESFDNNLVDTTTEQSNDTSDILQTEHASLESTHFPNLSGPFHDAVVISEHSLQIPDSSEFMVDSELPHTETVNYSLTPVSNHENHSPTNEFSTPITIKKERENSASLKRERSENWQHQETKLLLKLWEKYYDELKKYKRNSNVWDKMAQELRTNGFERNAAQCKSRVRVLMAKYKSCFVNDIEDPEAVDGFDYFEDLKRLISGNLSRVVNTPNRNSPAHYTSTSRSHQHTGPVENNGRVNGVDDDEVFESNYKRSKVAEQMYEVIQHLMRRDEREDNHQEIEHQIRKKKRQEKINLRAEKERRREDRARLRDEELRKVIMIQSELMASLIESIKRS